MEVPSASGAIDTDRILVRPTPTQVAYLPDARWTAAAPVMLQSALVETFLRSNAFRYVGRPAKFQITVRNDGDAPATQTVLVDALPAGTKFVSASAAGKAADGQVVTFAPLAQLAPKAKATYRLVVKGIKTGDVRFAASMTSDQIKTPVQETESTNIYE